jgi:hypothetical protein
MSRRWICTASLFWFALSLAPAPGEACSCVGMKRTRKEIREIMAVYWEGSDNIVLVRTLEESHTEDWDRQRATLVVEKVWKGTYRVGDKIRSDTQAIGAGMCDAPVPLRQSFPLFFGKEPVRISGCPSDFELTEVERRELNRLAAKDRANNRDN